MRKSSKFIIVAGALAALAVPSVASANVSVDDNGVGSVGKGDVQTALGLPNDGAMQDLFKTGSIRFTVKKTTVSDQSWKCDGSDQQYYMTVSNAWNVNAVPNTNAAGKLTNGWNMTGLKGSTYLSGSRSGAPYAGYCLGEFGGFNDTKFTYTTGTMQVTGGSKTVDLPNTPVALPAV